MKDVLKALSNWGRSVASAWDQFWFTPALPHTLALIRILGGAMLLYTHAVWSINLNAFLGRESWLSAETAALLNRDVDGNNFAWSYLYYVDSPALLWTLHVAALGERCTGRREQASGGRLHPERREVLAGHQLHADALGRGMVLDGVHDGHAAGRREARSLRRRRPTLRAPSSGWKWSCDTVAPTWTCTWKNSMSRSARLCSIVNGFRRRCNRL
jgi:hypothetical protein